MEEEFISIKQILEYMDSGRPFSISYVTADQRRGTGGSLLSFNKVLKTGIAVKDGTRLTASVIKTHSPAAKPPNHSQHFTRNIVLPDRTVKKVHIDLITRFNGKKVL